MIQLKLSMVLGLVIIISQICMTVGLLTTPKDSFFVRFNSDMVVPAKQPHQGTLFFWPGLQPGNGYNFKPIDNGVLQPVLTWGNSCAPDPSHKKPKSYSAWWISGQYVNTIGHYQGYTGCKGGNVMTADVGDILHMEMWLTSPDGSTKGVWHQKVINNSTGKSVTFDIDMQGQGQNWAEVVSELYSPPKMHFTLQFMNMYLVVNEVYNGYCQGTPKQSGFQCSQFERNGKACSVKKCTKTFNGIQNTSSLDPAVAQQTAALRNM